MPLKMCVVACVANVNFTLNDLNREIALFGCCCACCRSAERATHAHVPLFTRSTRMPTTIQNAPQTLSDTHKPITSHCLNAARVSSARISDSVSRANFLVLRVIQALYFVCRPPRFVVKVFWSFYFVLYH